MKTCALPACAYIHRDGDEKHKDLVALMIKLEENPADIECVIGIVRKRIGMGDRMIASSFLDYARSLEHADAGLLDSLRREIAGLDAHPSR